MLSTTTRGRMEKITRDGEVGKKPVVIYRSYSYEWAARGAALAEAPAKHACTPRRAAPSPLALLRVVPYSWHRASGPSTRMTPRSRAREACAGPPDDLLRRRLE